MNKASYVYTVYIATTAEQVWKALVQGDLTRQYWGHENVSDWKVGSKWEHRRGNASGDLMLVGKVVEVTPPKRLVMTWAAPPDAADMSKHSRVTFEIEPIAKMVKLTVTHAELEAGSGMEKGIQEGWPRVLSSLKSFLETGTPLDVWAGKGA